MFKPTRTRAHTNKGYEMCDSGDLSLAFWFKPISQNSSKIRDQIIIFSEKRSNLARIEGELHQYLEESRLGVEDQEQKIAFKYFSSPYSFWVMIFHYSSYNIIDIILGWIFICIEWRLF